MAHRHRSASTRIYVPLRHIATCGRPQCTRSSSREASHKLCGSVLQRIAPCMIYRMTSRPPGTAQPFIEESSETQICGTLSQNARRLKSEDIWCIADPKRNRQQTQHMIALYEPSPSDFTLYRAHGFYGAVTGTFLHCCILPHQSCQRLA